MVRERFAGRMKMPPSRSSIRTFDRGLSPSSRRIGAGRTIWPLLESVVCMCLTFSYQVLAVKRRGPGEHFRRRGGHCKETPFRRGPGDPMAFVTPSSAAQDYDVVVVGSGAAGGQAAYT